MVMLTWNQPGELLHRPNSIHTDYKSLSHFCELQVARNLCMHIHNLKQSKSVKIQILTMHVSILINNFFISNIIYPNIIHMIV